MSTELQCSCGQLVPMRQDGVRVSCPACGRFPETGSQMAPDLAFRAVLVEEAQVPPEPRPQAWDVDETWTPPRRRRLPLRYFDANWPREHTWLDCVAFPFRAWRLLMGLAFALTLTGLIFSGTTVFRESDDVWSFFALQFWFVWLSAAVPGLYALGLFACTLRSGAAGDTSRVHWPGTDVRLLGKSALAGLVAFLAGPVIPTAMAGYFWLNSGQLTVIDRLILHELMFVSVGYGLLVFVAVILGDRWSAAAPPVVLGHARRLGSWGLLGPCVAYAIIFVHFRLGLALLEESHHSPASWPLIFFLWMSLLCFLSFLLRGLGIHRFHRQREAPVLEATLVEAQPALS